MPTQDLVDELLALPPTVRADLAHLLWQSLSGTPELLIGGDEQEAIALAKQRDAEIESGAEVPLTHEQVMSAARQALGCG